MRPDMQLNLLVFAVLVFCLFEGSARAVTDITDCQALTTNGMEYRLTANISVVERITCFNITADNITINGNGNRIDYRNVGNPPAGVINITNRINVTIKDVFMNESSVGNIMLINIKNSNNTRITNTNFTTDYVAVFSDGWVMNSVFINNNFSFGYPFFYEGDALTNFSNSSFEGNKFTGCSVDACFYCSNTANAFCVNNTFTNNIFNRSTAYGNPYLKGVASHQIINTSWNWTNNGYSISIGNVWTNYTTATGFNNQCTDADQNGICDTTFKILTDNEDYAPLSNNPLKYIISYTETWPAKTIETMNGVFYKSILSVGCTNTSTSFWHNGTNKGYTNVTTTGGFSNYTYYGATNNLQNEINQTNMTFWWDIKCGSANIENTTRSHFVERLRVTRCAAPMSNGSVKFRLWDENTVTLPVIANFGSTFVVWIDSGYRNYSFANTSYADYDFCIFPNVAYNANISATYRNTSYSTRNYFAQNAPLSASLSTIDLYMLSLVNSTNVAFTVYNINKIPQGGVILKVLRYYPDSGTFKVVAYGLTGYEGTVTIPLEFYQYYQYIVSLSGQTLSSYASSQLSSATQNLYISQGNYIGLFNWVNGVSGVCTANNVTYALSCTYTDTSGQMTSISLVAKRLMAANYTSAVCTTSSTASSGTLTCNLAPYNNSLVNYALSATFNDGSRYVLDNGWVNWNTKLLQLGTLGIFLAFILIITLFFAGMMSSPSAAIILSCIGILLSSLINLIDIGWGNLLPLLLVGVIIVYKIEGE